ncbi:chaperonin-like RbcX protein 2, chloroplastic [Momordica charantia]|uniref:Chaperonin-like RbcX protein 2, chloroplastic n=1 Tax=Momordica charantia TaxID=3673 RepID=A0A6J1D422_MOMCH|nr:chaperonin-like RbcX protein 2, chloroplastic [Momordica charantia]
MVAVGASFVVGAPVLDSPALCLDSPPITSMSLRSGGDLVLRRKSKAKNRLAMPGSTLDLRSSFVNSGGEWRLSAGAVGHRSRRNQRRNRRLVIANEFAGQYEDSFDDVKMQIQNYFTYKAVRTVLNQLYEMNPTQYRWFYDFVTNHKPGDGKRFIRTLVKEKQDLAERVMITRLHLYGKWVKKCDHAEIYKEISDENLDLMRERLMETVIWPSEDKSF